MNERERMTPTIMAIAGFADQCITKYDDVCSSNEIEISYRFDGPSPTMVSNIAPHKVRCGGRIARGSLPGVTPATPSKYSISMD